MRTVYVNGAYVPENEASVSIFDRGFLFADAVYEVTSVLDGKLIDFAGHAARLKRSLGELGIKEPVNEAELLAIHRELIARNDLREGMIYLEVSRGAANDRDFLFPGDDVAPTLVLFTQAKSLIDSPLVARGQKVITADDLRWRRGDVKTVQLLYACMVKNMAKARGADDVWLMRDGEITEGASNNTYIVTQDNRIITRQLTNDILGGITRTALLKCAHDLQMTVEERPFTLEEVAAAKEAFSTSASAFVAPVVQVDDIVIGSGEPGPVALRLRETYLDQARAAAI
jgi:D-alanine transaminase